MDRSSSRPTPPPSDALESLLADLEIAERDVAPLGRGGPAANRVLAVGAGTPVPKLFESLASELEEGGALLLYVEGAPGDEELAAWRNRLWPLLHVVAIYDCNESGVRRRKLGESETIAGRSPLVGAVLIARRRSHVLSPTATVEKFDANAAGWNGEPGTPGYPHFRWMRRHLGLFAPAPPRARILDFGCGAGWVGIEAARNCERAELCFFDPSAEMVRIASSNAAREGIERAYGRVGFGEEPPFPRAGEEPFDLVVSSGVISFSPDPELWLDGLARTVRPGGAVVIGDIHLDSRGFQRRRSNKPLLPARELNAQPREHVRRGLEQRGFEHVRSGSYQLTWPIPQVMHLSETRLRGTLTWPLLALNRAGASFDRALGSRLPDWFDSWVMHLRRT